MKAKGWFYFLLPMFLVALVLLYRDLEIDLKKLAVISIGAGYVLGVIFYSLSDYLKHWTRWIFNIYNYRHTHKSRSRRLKLQLRWKP